jgi:hypothetical protein
LLFHFCCSEAASTDGFAKIAKGMTEADVRALVGEPDQMRRDPQGRARYYYGGFPKLRWCGMEVSFDSGGRVTGKFHDH